jgi:segregation and condensation protein B
MTVYPRAGLGLAIAANRSGTLPMHLWPGHSANRAGGTRWPQVSIGRGRDGRLGTGDDSSTPTPSGDQDEDPIVRRKRTEAVLLFHRGPVNLRKLAALAGLSDATEARTRIRELNQIYDQSGSALRVEEVAAGHQLLTRPSLAPWLRRIKHIPPPVQLGEAAMETLAIIAYRQPVLRADVEAIRGVACGELIRQLMQRDLVRISGRSEDLGRPYLYGTTPYFLQIFGLKNMGAIPSLPGASIPDDSEDTLAIQEDTSQANDADSPIEPPMNVVDLPTSSPFDVVTPKESDVSIAPGPVVIDEVADFLNSDSAIAIAERPLATQPDIVAVDDDEDDDYFDDDEDDVDDEDDEEDWDDDDDVEDDEEEDDWEEVGDEDEVEDEEVEVEESGEEDEEDEESEDEIDEDDDDVWDDDEDDDDWDEDDDEEEEEWD